MASEQSETSPSAAAPSAPIAASAAGAEGEGEQSSEAGSPAPEGAGESGEDSEGEGEGGAEGEEGASAEAGGDAAGGKRKRRRRKKGKGPRAEGEAAEAPPSDEARGRRRDAPIAPFSRFFTANAGRKHGFAVGEVVAGRVKAVEHGTITVDLFGKALAYADEHEPRELPPEPELAPPFANAPIAPVLETAVPAEAGAVSSAADSLGEASAAPAAVPGEVGEVGAEPATEAVAAEAATEAAPVEAAHVDASAATEPGVDLDAVDDVQHDDAHHDDDGGDDDHEGGRTARGPLAPAPIVPEHFPRPEMPALGSVFRGRVGAVAESGHIALVNRIIDRKAVLANAERYRVERRRVQGLVYGFNRGGFDVLVEGLRAFCPASAMALEEINDPNELVGQRFEFLLPASQNLSKDLIVSRRSILERQLRKKAKELIKALQPGQRLKGRVTQVRDFGVFVDIGGIEGLVHQSELSFAHNVRPADVVKPGDEVDVQVLRVGADPRRTSEGVRRERIDRVSLSMKALMPDPWDAHAELLTEGTVRSGKVTRTTDFGAFIELAPQVEGLLHITELGRDLQHASQAVKEGDELQVVIERVDNRARRISLSKLTAQEAAEIAAAEGEETPRSLRPGSRITVKVARVEPRGLVVRVAGVVGKRSRGYVPSIELVRSQGGDLRKTYPVGSELDVKIVGIDRDGGLRCSPKALQIDDERRAVKDYRREAAKQGFGTFGDLLRAKLGEGK